MGYGLSSAGREACDGSRLPALMVWSSKGRNARLPRL